MIRAHSLRGPDDSSGPAAPNLAFFWLDGKSGISIAPQLAEFQCDTLANTPPDSAL